MRSTSEFESQDFALCTRRVGTIAPCSRAYVPTGWPFFEKEKRGQGAARLDAIGRDQLRDIEDVNGWKAGVFRFGGIDPGEGGVGGAEVYADFHPDSGGTGLAPR